MADQVSIRQYLTDMLDYYGMSGLETKSEFIDIIAKRSGRGSVPHLFAAEFFDTYIDSDTGWPIK